MSPKESQLPNQFLAFRLPVDIYVHLRSRMCPASSATCTLNLTLHCIVDYLDILSRSAPSANAETPNALRTRLESRNTRFARSKRHRPSSRPRLSTTNRGLRTHDQPTNQPINQPINQPTNQSTNQPTNRPPSTTNNDNRVRSPNSYCVAVRACVSEDR